MTTIVYDVIRKHRSKMGPCLSKFRKFLKKNRVYAPPPEDEEKKGKGVRQFLSRFFNRFRKNANTVLPAVIPGIGPQNTASITKVDPSPSESMRIEIFFDDTVGDILGESSPVPANILSKYTAGSNSDASSCTPPVPKASSQVSATGCMSVMAKAELARRLGQPIRGIEKPYSDRPVGAYRPTGNVKVLQPKKFRRNSIHYEIDDFSVLVKYSE